MKNEIKLKKDETLVEYIYNNRELANHPIVIYGDAEFKKYELRCVRSNGNHDGYNNLYKLSLPYGEFNISTKSSVDLTYHSSKDIVYIHRLQEIETTTGELIYSIKKALKSPMVLKQDEIQEEM